MCFSIFLNRQNSFIRCSICPQSLETAVRFIPALDLKLNDKVNPSHDAWQAGVRRSLASFIHQSRRFLASGCARMKLHLNGTANRRILNIEPQDLKNPPGPL